MARYSRFFTGDRRTSRCNIKLTPAERVELEWAAARRGVTLSDYARELLLRRSAAVVAASPRNPEAKALLRELHAIGNNLNQIAKHLNTYGEPRDAAELRAALAAHKKAMARTLAL